MDSQTLVQNAAVSIQMKPMEKFQEAILKLAETHPNVALTPAGRTLLHGRLNQFASHYKTPDHPPYSAMIERALRELNVKLGSTENSISQFLEKEHDHLPFAHSILLKHHLQKLCECGEIVLTRHNRYKLAKENPKSPKNSSTKPKGKPVKRQKNRQFKKKKQLLKRSNNKKGKTFVDIEKHQQLNEEEQRLITENGAHCEDGENKHSEGKSQQNNIIKADILAANAEEFQEREQYKFKFSSLKRPPRFELTGVENPPSLESGQLESVASNNELSKSKRVLRQPQRLRRNFPEPKVVAAHQQLDEEEQGLITENGAHCEDGENKHSEGKSQQNNTKANILAANGQELQEREQYEVKFSSPERPLPGFESTGGENPPHLELRQQESVASTKELSKSKLLLRQSKLRLLPAQQEEASQGKQFLKRSNNKNGKTFEGIEKHQQLNEEEQRLPTEKGEHCEDGENKPSEGKSQQKNIIKADILAANAEELQEREQYKFKFSSPKRPPHGFESTSVENPPSLESGQLESVESNKELSKSKRVLRQSQRLRRNFQEPKAVAVTSSAEKPEDEQMTLDLARITLEKKMPSEKQDSELLIDEAFQAVKLVMKDNKLKGDKKYGRGRKAKSEQSEAVSTDSLEVILGLDQVECPLSSEQERQEKLGLLLAQREEASQGKQLPRRSARLRSAKSEVDKDENFEGVLLKGHNPKTICSHQEKPSKIDPMVEMHHQVEAEELLKSQSCRRIVRRKSQCNGCGESNGCG